MTANVIETIAIRECHLNAISLEPFVFLRTGMRAVSSILVNVKIPIYIMSGFPKMLK